ncbi:hypothetical protein HWB57_gp126 [Erwinia phage vB_EamM-Bue1]|uniref:Uncharacterized protein n=1 Tax=Erwinia phage vB_EamM-Bue1 TaxID=2099338 RepID=A0A2P1JUH1_9CAUD|nr:hypothetical protein HWB57_gp126 [Erwinia phage vB_EamM-Bue1]AVO22963.1 hypothetical protein [Erwinia phage vB_EamM-Bue1]
MTGHVHPHKIDKRPYGGGCHCVFCRPLERPCNCEGCAGIRWKQFKITHLEFPEAKPEFVPGHRPPQYLANRAPGSTMDMSWFWDGKVLKLDVGESVETDFRKITRIK